MPWQHSEINGWHYVRADKIRKGSRAEDRRKERDARRALDPDWSAAPVNVPDEVPPGPVPVTGTEPFPDPGPAPDAAADEQRPPEGDTPGSWQLHGYARPRRAGDKLGPLLKGERYTKGS